MTERHKQILLAVGIAALVWIVLFAIYRVAVMQPTWNYIHTNRTPRLGVSALSLWNSPGRESL